MSATDTPKSRMDEIRQAWRDANVTPLWETTAHKPADSTPRAYHWKWQVLRPLIDHSEGDLIITPGMSWHAHSHDGTAPIVWFDALDVPLHQYLGTAVFEPGPPKDLPKPTDDAAFAVPNIVPELPGTASQYSPVFRYPWSASLAALAAAPLAEDGSRKIRYVNPLTGGPVMSLVDCFMTRVEAGAETIPYRSTSNAVGVVVEGTGSSRVGNETFAWQPKDIFSMPHGNWVSHRCASGIATIFVVTDREVLRRLDLLSEEYGNERRVP